MLAAQFSLHLDRVSLYPEISPLVRGLAVAGVADPGPRAALCVCSFPAFHLGPRETAGVADPGDNDLLQIENFNQRVAGRIARINHQRTAVRQCVVTYGPLLYRWGNIGGGVPPGGGRSTVEI